MTNSKLFSLRMLKKKGKTDSTIALEGLNLNNQPQVVLLASGSGTPLLTARICSKPVTWPRSRCVRSTATRGDAARAALPLCLPLIRHKRIALEHETCISVDFPAKATAELPAAPRLGFGVWTTHRSSVSRLESGSRRT